MNKKDTVFISTTLMLKDKFQDFEPDKNPKTNKKFSEDFIDLYRYLCLIYDDCNQQH